jgi:hypothetical protein
VCGEAQGCWLGIQGGGFGVHGRGRCNPCLSDADCLDEEECFDSACLLDANIECRDGDCSENEECVIVRLDDRSTHRGNEDLLSRCQGAD